MTGFWLSSHVDFHVNYLHEPLPPYVPLLRSCKSKIRQALIWLGFGRLICNSFVNYLHKPLPPFVLLPVLM